MGSTIPNDKNFKNFTIILTTTLGTIMALWINIQLAFAVPPYIGILQMQDVRTLTLKDIKPKIKASVRLEVFKKSITPLALEDPIVSGVSWLELNQNSDGSWSKDQKTCIRDTEEVLEALYWLNYQQSDAFSKAVDWFRYSFPGSNDYIARKIYAFSLALEDTTSHSNFLADQINPNGGFGYQAGYGSDILTSALVLRALTASGYEDPGDNPDATVSAILNYLLTSTNADGAWGYRHGDASALYPTLLVLEALLPYQSFTLEGPGGDIIIATKIELALLWVLSKQQADGGFGSGSSNIALSTLAYHTLLQYGVYPIDNERAISYLLNSQEPDGSWNAQDPYATASALMALGRPDITVTDIQQLTDLLPNQTTKVQVTIQNIGYTATQPIPANQLTFLIDGQEFPVEGDIIPPIEPSISQDLEITITGLSAGEHTIGLRVDYENTELRKNNNSREEAFTWHNPVFTGPAPPSWIGATTGWQPNSIFVTWLPSTDPKTQSYDIYIGVQSNQYFGFLGPTGGTWVLITGFALDIPYYFSVVAKDANGNRGDYSMESSAIARSNPDALMGQVSGSVMSNGQPLSDVKITVYNVAEGVVSGSYSANLYPGDYYITASKQGYEEVRQTVHLPDNGNVTGVDFDLPIIDDGTPPPAITGVAATPDNGQVHLSWNPSGATDFSRYNIYRKTSSFTNITGMSPLASLPNPATNSYTDSSVVNGISYYYAITAVDLAENEFKDVSSAGPAKPNSAPAFSNLNAYQRSDGMVQTNYDVADQENPILTLNLEYWLETGWQAAAHSSGMGTQPIGTGKVALWEAKKDADGFDQNIKIRLTASDGEAVNPTTQVESALFHLDTLNPPLPSIDAVESPTSVRNQVLKGAKEEGTALLLNGKEIKALDTGAEWSHEVTLSEGTNTFSFVAKDAFGNLSGTQGVTIVLDTLPPDGSVSVVEVQQTSPTELRLSWGAVTKDLIGNPETIEKYLIYRGTTANFEPSAENLVGESEETSYIDDTPGIIGDTDVNYYYAIEAVDGAGNRSWLANRVGEYDVRLYITTGGDYTWVSVPLDLEGIEMTSQLADYIESHTDKETTVLSISSWNAVAQSYTTYTIIPFPLGDHSIKSGEAYRVELDIDGRSDVFDNTIVTFVGKVPTPRTFELKTTTGTDYTWISLPVGYPDITMASQFRLFIEAHTEPSTTIITISEWNAVAQSYTTYSIIPFELGDFPVKEGRSYRVEASQDCIFSP